MHKKRRIIGFSILIVLICTMFFVCTEAFARAGGGQGYSGGSSGGSSSGGGGGAIGALIRVLFRVIWDFLMDLCEKHPAVGYPLTALFIFFIIAIIIWGYCAKTKEESELDVDPFANTNFNKSSGIKPSRSSNRSSGSDLESILASKTSNTKSNSDYDNLSTKQNLDNKALLTIKSIDPDFNEKEFCKRAEKAFKLIQLAWSNRDLSKVEAFLGDGTFEQFLIQLGIMKENHIIDVMEDLKVSSSTILGYESDGNIDTIVLGIYASGKNYRADEKTKAYIEGDKNVTSFTEAWTFLRRHGSKTLKKPGLIEGYCPNCGTKINIGRHTNCSSCGCLLRSGEHDWVLVNITQSIEWSRNNNKLIPGFSKYIGFDEGFSIQHIEDLASMMFWRKHSAERYRNIAPLRKIACDKYCESVSKTFEPSDTYKYYDECAIGSIKVLAVDADKSEKEDFIYVEIAWSGILKSIKDKNTGFGSSFKKMFQKKENIRSIFVLKRKRGVMTDVKTSICAAPCPNCGAMESHSSSNECEYCGTVMNEGNRDWVIEDVISSDDVRVTNAILLVKRNLTKPIKFKGYTKPSAKKQFNNAGSNQTAVTIDDSSNNQTQNNPSLANNLSANALGVAAGAAIGAATLANAMNQIPPRMSPEDQVKWLIGMMLVDNNVNKIEFAVICDYAAKLGISNEKVGLLVKELMSHKGTIDYLINNVPLVQNVDLMQALVRVAFADGKIAKEELGFIRYLAKRMNIGEIKLKELFEIEKNRLSKLKTEN